HPTPNDLLSFAAAMPWQPARIKIGGIEEIPSIFNEGVHDSKGCLLVSGPAPLHCPQAERRYLQARSPQFTVLHIATILLISKSFFPQVKHNFTWQTNPVWKQKAFSEPRSGGFEKAICSRVTICTYRETRTTALWLVTW